MPLNPSTQILLALLQQQSGDATSAKAHFDTYLDIATSDAAHQRLGAAERIVAELAKLAAAA